MKRIAALLLSLLLTLSLVGCVGPFPDSIPDSNSDGGASVSQSTTTTSVEGGTGDTATTTEDAAGTTVVGVDTDTTTQKGGQAGTTQKPTTTTTQNNNTTKDNPTTTKKPTSTTVVSAEQVLVDKAFALTGSQTLQATLTGTIVSIRETYNAGYGNATFTIRVRGTHGDKDLLCYRCKPNGATEVAVGQTVTLSGTIINYNGTIEFNNTSTYTIQGGTVTTTTTRAPVSGSIDEGGIYDSKEDVGLYIHLYGKLPKNYVKKSQYNKEKNLCVGGDRFYNKEGLLPSGYTYYECDIDTYGITSRGAKRLVWTTSGIVYYTSDHYASFTQLYGAR